jgi:sugar/nucleoside kinase (ribokinase family)
VRFVALGEVMVDVVCDDLPAAGERIHAPVAVRAGGSPVNAAFCAAELGASACVVGRIGSDPAGDLVRNSLSARGIEARLAQDDELSTGTAVALGVDEAAGFVADRGANARLSEDDVPDPLEWDALLVSGFALFQAGSADAASAGLRRFTGNWAGVDLGSPRLAATADLQHATGANVVFATAEEAKALTGAEPEEAAHELASRFTVASVKLGKNGALAARGDVVARAAPPQVAPNATFGSGDAFAAAFLLALAGGDDLLAALERACEAGARWSGASPRC